jgi:hypothetical protein
MLRTTITSSWRPLALSLALFAVLLAAVAGPASANFSLTDFGGSMLGSGGQRDLRAGGHPNFTTDFKLSWHVGPNGWAAPDANPKDVEVRLPAGLIGYASGVRTCPIEKLAPGPGLAFCHPDSQVGNVEVTLARDGAEPDLVGDATDYFPIGIYNIDPPRGVVARFGFNVAATIVMLDAKVSADGEYHAEVRSLNTSRGLAVIGARATFWGVPSDPGNDPQRVGFVDGIPQIRGSSSLPRRSFLTLPTRCTGEPLKTSLRLNSWEFPDEVLTASFDHDFNGDPLTIEGCDDLAFDPAISFAPTSKRADSPTGLDVELDVPQTDDPDAASTAHLRDVTATLPEGLTINPASADGLQACSDAQLGLGSDERPACPDGSKVGSVLVTTPVLENPLNGSVFVRSQADDDPESGQLFRLAMVIDDAERGVVVKVPGELHVNASTGRITAVFRNNPQVPVERVELSLKSGPRSPLATPVTCGSKSIDTGLTSWAGHDIHASSSFDVACRPGLGSFGPSFSAGTMNPVAGGSSPFALRVQKPDGQSDLNGIAMVLPDGLLANLKGNIGTRVGTARVAAGPGSNPFWLSGPVVLEGPYGDAPFSLRVTVPAVAGPFNLGDVVVRQKIYVDPETAQVTVVSDPLPTVVKGVPVRLQNLAVDIDKPGFMINPTSCTAKEVKATLSSVAGQAAPVTDRFQVGECASVGYTPKLTLTMSGKGQTKDGSHPALKAHLVPPVGDANTKKTTVTLPLALALDPGNANGLCEPVDAARNTCPAKSIVGSAEAESVLPDKLKGPVYFVRGERVENGRVRKTLPKLFIPLSANGVTVYIHASSDVEDDRLVTTFDNLPDAPFSSFDLNINGGEHGILAVSNTNTCAVTNVADAEFGGQNGKAYTSMVTMGTPCALGVVKSSHTSTALKLTVGGLGAGKVSASGNGVTKSSRSLTSATTATLTLKLSKATRRALARHRDVKVKVKVAFTAKGQKKAKTATKTVVIHGAKKR